MKNICKKGAFVKQNKIKISLMPVHFERGQKMQELTAFLIEMSQYSYLIRIYNIIFIIEMQFRISQYV